MNSNDICFGFLGTAKKRKGFNEIPNLIAFFKKFMDLAVLSSKVPIRRGRNMMQ
jgi:hypothetical protein